MRFKLSVAFKTNLHSKKTWPKGPKSSEFPDVTKSSLAFPEDQCSHSDGSHAIPLWHDSDSGGP